MDMICHCYGISRDDIVEAIQNGLTTLNEISEETGASHGCGSCNQRLADVVKEELDQ